MLCDRDLRIIGSLPETTIVGTCTRELNRTSKASMIFTWDANECTTCNEKLARIYRWHHGIAIYRDGELIWAGPITNMKHGYGALKIDCADASAWFDRRLINDVDASRDPDPDISQVVEVMFDAAFTDDPTPNLIKDFEDVGQTADYQIDSDSHRYFSAVLAELRAYGFDWTVIAKRFRLRRTRPIPERNAVTLDSSHFSVPPVIEEIGNVQATRVTVIGRDGVFGVAQNQQYIDYYGLIERKVELTDLPTQRDCETAAEAYLAAWLDPIFAAPSGSAFLTPRAPVKVNELVPGRVVRISINCNTRQVTGVPFVIRSVTFKFDGTVRLVLAPPGDRQPSSVTDQLIEAQQRLEALEAGRNQISNWTIRQDDNTIYLRSTLDGSELPIGDRAAKWVIVDDGIAVYFKHTSTGQRIPVATI
jgi:hypothetical protein